jgi:DNA mismatch endonuclease (patch repair protein)
MPRRYTHPPASTDMVRDRMQSQSRENTSCELALRRSLHRLGLRYRVHERPLPEWRRRADVVFRKARVAVFVDGCFWHGCRDHGSEPKANAEWWLAKIDRNRSRDSETDEKLRAHGWEPVRVWEHADPEGSATRIAEVVRRRLGRR